MREGNVLSRVCLLVCLFTGGPTIQDPGPTPSLHGPSTRFHFRRYRGTPLLSWSILFSFSCSFEKAKFEQECIPVGCVPAARRPYAGVCFPGGVVPGPGVGCMSGPGVGCLPGPGVGCLPGPGVSASSRGGLPCLGGYGIPAYTEADTLPAHLWTDTHL